MYDFKIVKSTNNFIIYEFQENEIDYFVRFYLKESELWRRGYWFSEKNYFQNNINKIELRLPNESNPQTIERLENELDYFKSKLEKSEEKNYFNKTNPLKLINIISSITSNFLNKYNTNCNILEIQHMKKEDELTSIRAKLTERILPKYLNSEWNYLLIKSTSYVFKKSIDLNNYNLEIY